MLQSPPSWRRGLKFLMAFKEQYPILSPPSWRRGLKFQFQHPHQRYKHVASFLEAWIEIYRTGTTANDTRVASFLEAWIEIPALFNFRMSLSRRLLLGGVD